MTKFCHDTRNGTMREEEEMILRGYVMEYDTKPGRQLLGAKKSTGGREVGDEKGRPIKIMFLNAIKQAIIL